MSRPLRIIRLLANLRSIFRAAFLLLVLAACTEPLPEFPIPGAAPIEQPAEFEAWWQDIERCAQRARPDSVSYWVIEGSAFDVEGVRSVAAYQWTARRMYFARRYLLDPGTVRHEMLHAVLPPINSTDYEKQHPAEYFRDRCGSLVDP